MASDGKTWLSGQGSVLYHDMDMANQCKNNPLIGVKYKTRVLVCQQNLINL